MTANDRLCLAPLGVRWIRGLGRVWAGVVVGLVVVTWRLWFPSGEAGQIPPIGLITAAAQIPLAVHWIASLMLLGSLILVAAGPVRFAAAWWLVAAALVVLFVLDQHRLQPWAYQSAIYALVFATMPPHAARRALIVVAASVYLYSAAGKFDYQFTHTVGQQFLAALAAPLGGLPGDLDAVTRVRLALVLPTVELLAGLGLLIRPLRPIAGIVVIGMHLSLIVILGPWNLNHSFGVLGWNVLLIAQAWLLFVRPGWKRPVPKPAELDSPAPDPAATDPVAASPVAPALRWTPGRVLTMVVVGVAVIAPLGERFGYWDHWLSWSLYSPHTSRVEVELHRSAIESLAPSIQAFVEPDADGDRWHTLAVDRWSLATRGAAVYPQARYQLAVAIAVARSAGLKDEIRVRVRGTADRWTGRRQEQQLMGLAELERRQ